MKRILYLAWGLLLTATLNAQTPCNSESFLRTFTSNSSVGIGLTLCASGDGNIYASGTENNRTTLLKLTPDGDVIWSRSFSVDVLLPAAISEMFVDSDGMLVAAGIQAGLQQGNPSSLVFRYNPNTNAVMWSKSFAADSVTVDGIIEKTPGGNYLFYQTSAQPFTQGIQSEILEVDRATGNVVPTLAQRFSLNGFTGLARVISHQGALYAVGTAQTLPVPVPSFRTLLARMDATNGSATWANVTYGSGTPDDIIGVDLLADGNSLLSLSSSTYIGDTASLTGVSMYLQKNTLDGAVVWGKKYVFPGFSNVLAAEIVKLSTGYAVYGAGTQTLGVSQIFMLLDNDGNVISAKTLSGFDQSGTLALRGEAIVVNDHLYATGATAGDSDIDWSLLKTDASLTLNTNCNYLQATTAQAQSISDLNAVNVSLSSVPSSTPAVNRPIAFATTSIASQLTCSGCQTNCSVFRDQTIELAPGGSVVVNGVTYTSPTTVTVTVPSTTGCDVITTYTIQFATTVPPGQCDASSFVKTFTNSTTPGTGQTLCASGDGNLYASGLEGNRTTILKVSPNGDVIWSRSFVVDALGACAISEMIVDSDGMLVAAGIQASTTQANPSSLVFRYNPNTNAVMWSKSFAADSVTVDGIIEKTPGGNYVFYQTSFAPFTTGVQAEVLEIDRGSGNVVPSLARRYTLNNAAGIARIVSYQGALYAVGTAQTLPIPVVSLRTLLAKLDATNGQPAWANVTYGPGTAEDFIGVDMLVDNNAILTLSSSTYIDLNSITSGTTTPISMYLQKNSLNGDIIWMKKYSSPAFSNVMGSEIVKLNNGYAIYGASTSDLNVSQLLVLIDNDGNVISTRRLGGFEQSAPLALRGEAIALNNAIYLNGTVADGNNSLDTDWSLMKADSALTINADCSYLQTTGTLNAQAVVAPGATAVSLLVTNSSTPAINRPITFAASTISSTLYCYSCVNTGVLTVTCDADITATTNAGEPSTVVDYDLPTATTTCPNGTNITYTLISGLPVGAPFPVGTTTVCYLAQDQCGNTSTCCFSVNVIQGESTCDSKVVGCFRWELLPIKLNSVGERRYRIKITNNCPAELDYVLFQVPNGVTAEAPADGSTYVDAISGRSYIVRNPNFSPFYSVRFKAAPTVIVNNGVSDILEYTLPQQSIPQYIHTLAKFRNGTTLEAYLNTFGCPILPPVAPNPGSERHSNQDLSLFPNPTGGNLLVDLGAWDQQSVRLEVLNAQGRLVQTIKIDASVGLQNIDIDSRLPNGLYQLVVRPSQGVSAAEPFILQRD